MGNENDCAKIEEQSPIQAEHGRLAGTVGRLEETFNALASKLGPILSDPEPRNNEGVDVSTTCVAGRQMREHSDKLHCIAEFMDDVLGRCQL